MGNSTELLIMKTKHKHKSKDKKNKKTKTIGGSAAGGPYYSNGDYLPYWTGSTWRWRRNKFDTFEQACNSILSRPNWWNGAENMRIVQTSSTTWDVTVWVRPVQLSGGGTQPGYDYTGKVFMFGLCTYGGKEYMSQVTHKGLFWCPLATADLSLMDGP